jgi:hypothetical protein
MVDPQDLTISRRGSRVQQLIVTHLRILHVHQISKVIGRFATCGPASAAIHVSIIHRHIGQRCIDQHRHTWTDHRSRIIEIAKRDVMPCGIAGMLTGISAGHAGGFTATAALQGYSALRREVPGNHGWKSKRGKHIPGITIGRIFFLHMTATPELQRNLEGI